MKLKFWDIASRMVISMAIQLNPVTNVSTTLPAFAAANARKDLKNPNGNRTQKINHFNANVWHLEMLTKTPNLISLWCDSILFSFSVLSIDVACNCNGHSNHCVFDESQGVDICQDCQHNTVGINCNRCKDGFYRAYGKHWNDTNVCQRKDHYQRSFEIKSWDQSPHLFFLHSFNF